MARLTPSWPQPSHPQLLEVIDPPGPFASLSRTLVSLPPGALLARIDTPPLALANKAYSTVQVSPTQHVELNCDFLFTNHSCEPSVEFHVRTTDETPAIEVRVAARLGPDGGTVGLQKGDDLTFFYPSTEWEMAQPFACNCGATSCRTWISGAKCMGMKNLQGLFLNDHIRNLLLEHDQGHGNGIGIGFAADGMALKQGLNRDAVHQTGDIGGRREASARALAGEMGGDTT